MAGKRRRDAGAVLSAERAEALLSGVDAFHLYRSEARMRLDWQANREELTRRCAEKFGPGRRPWAWWKFAAPEPRRRIGGEGVAAVDTAECPVWAKKWSWGRPVVWDNDYGDEPEGWFETQRDYLIRHNLLTPEEKRLLKVSPE